VEKNPIVLVVGALGFLSSLAHFVSLSSIDKCAEDLIFRTARSSSLSERAATIAVMIRNHHDHGLLDTSIFEEEGGKLWEAALEEARKTLTPPPQ
jgi:hypothetical protein